MLQRWTICFLFYKRFCRKNNVKNRKNETFMECCYAKKCSRDVDIEFFFNKNDLEKRQLKCCLMIHNKRFNVLRYSAETTIHFFCLMTPNIDTRNTKYLINPAFLLSSRWKNNQIHHRAISNPSASFPRRSMKWHQVKMMTAENISTKRHIFLL